MKTRPIYFVIIFITLLSSNPSFSQFRVESDGSIFTNSLSGNYGRANWTQVHYQHSCAYHLKNSYYGGDDVFYVRGDGMVWTRFGFLISSDSIYKTNIKTIDSPLTIIRNLRGVTYNRKYQKAISIAGTNEERNMGVGNNELEPTEYGLIAQEVERVIPYAVVNMHDSTKAISYSSIIPILIEAIKGQQSQIENLEDMILEHDREVADLRKLLSIKEKGKEVDSNNWDSNSDFPILYQNAPNPFSTITEIKYFLPRQYEKVSLYIHDMQGIEVRVYDLQSAAHGYNKISIRASELKPSLYIYSLVVDNKIIDSKRMLLTNK